MQRNIFHLSIYGFLHLLLLFTTSLQANNLAINNDIDCTIYARTGYIKTHTENSQVEKALAIGGNLSCAYSFNEVVTMNVGVHSSLNPNIYNDDTLHGDFFDANKNSYILLGESSLNLNFSNYSMILGRQRFDSPHMDSDDLRMVPNLFEAYRLSYGINENAELGFSYINKMSGWENGGDQSHFISIANAMGGNGNGAYVAWANYDHNNFDIQFWTYHIQDVENIFYAEAIYASDLGNETAYEIALQYDVGQETGKATLGDIDANTWGGKCRFK